MGDDIEDDLGDMVGLNDVRLNKASGALITDTSNPRTLSQIIAEAGRPVKKRKVLPILLLPLYRFLYISVVARSLSF